MNFSISKEVLQTAISTVIKAVPTKSNLANSDCIMIDAGTDEVRLVANNSEMLIQYIAPARVLEEGKVCLDSKFFQEMVRKLPDEDINIIGDDKYNLRFLCGKNIDFEYTGRSADTFSDIPKFEIQNSFELKELSLKEIIRQTIFSISDNESNKTLRGELFDIKNGFLRVVSLDGQRVSIRRIEINDSDITKKIIVPGKSLNDLYNILGKETDDEVTLHFTDNHLIATFKNTTFVTRLIDGEFFNVDNVITKDYSTKMKVNKRSIYECVDRSTIIAREGDKKAIVFNIKDDIIDIHMNSSMGKMNEKMEIEKEGNDLKIGFNPKFLTDALKVIDDENIYLYFSSPKSPCFIRDDEETYTYMILPVNLSADA